MAKQGREAWLEAPCWVGRLSGQGVDMVLAGRAGSQGWAGRPSGQGADMVLAGLPGSIGLAPAMPHTSPDLQVSNGNLLACIAHKAPGCSTWDQEIDPSTPGSTFGKIQQTWIKDVA